MKPQLPNRQERCSAKFIMTFRVKIEDRPGIFRGALDARAKRITTEMKLAAAKAVADCATNTLMPDMLDMNMHKRVTKAVREAWETHSMGEAAKQPEMAKV